MSTTYSAKLDIPEVTYNGSTIISLNNLSANGGISTNTYFASTDIVQWDFKQFDSGIYSTPSTNDYIAKFVETRDYIVSGATLGSYSGSGIYIYTPIPTGTILPYISGGSSFQLHVSGDAAGKYVNHIIISNYKEKTHPEVLTYPIGTLSGMYINNSVTGYNISGLLDYQTGSVTANFRNIPDILSLEPGNSGIYYKAQLYYNDVQFNTPVKYVSAAQLYINPYYSNNYYVSASIINSLFTPIVMLSSQVDYYPTQLVLNETDYNVTTASLKVMVEQNGTQLELSSTRSSNPSGIYLSWVADSSDVSGIFTFGSVVSTYKLSNVTSGWSLSTQRIQLVSNSTNAPCSYNVNCYMTTINDQQANISRLSASYIWNYDLVGATTLDFQIQNVPLTSENIIITKKIKSATTADTYYTNIPLNTPIVLNSNETGVTIIDGILYNDFSTSKYWNSNISPFSLSGNTGLLSSINYYGNTSTGVSAVTATENIYGFDYIKLLYPNDINVYSTVAYVSSNPTISGVHSFQQYYTPTNIAISTINFDNTYETRVLTLKILGSISGSNYYPLHYSTPVKWDIDISNGVVAKDLNGNYYSFGSLTDDVLTLYISTATFDNISAFPSLCGYTISAYAYDANTGYLNAFNTYNFIIDTFPNNNLFNINMMLNYENASATPIIYRNPPFLVSALDTSTITTDDTGIRIFDFGDGSTTSAYLTTHTYSTPGTYKITLTRENVNDLTWYLPHSKSISVSAVVVTIPTATFIAYPSYVWSSALSGKLQLGPANVISKSRGVCAYDVMNNEVFNLSASNYGGLYNYAWFVDNNPLNINNCITTYTAYGLLTGSEIKLGLYNDNFPSNMPQYYNSDVNGTLTKYFNITSTSNNNSNKLFQHIRTFNYDINYPTITNYTSSLIIKPNNTNIINVSTTIIKYPPGTPFANDIVVVYNDLSSSTWYNNNQSTISYIGTGATFNLYHTYDKNQKASIGYIKDNYIGHLKLDVYGSTTTDLSGTCQSITVDSVAQTIYIGVTGAPAPALYTETRYPTIGDVITFENRTLLPSIVSAYVFNNGESDENITTYDYLTSFTTSYSSNNTFSPILSVVLTDTTIYSKTFNDMIIVTPSQYDPTLGRIFGTPIGNLPYLSSEIGINEWGIADNVNRVFDKLNANNEYISDNVRFYHLPPIKYLGWIGSTTIRTDGWNDVEDGITTVDSVTGMFISLQDIFIKGHYLYAIDDNKIKIYKNDINDNFTLIAQTDRKSVDVIFKELKSIYVDKNNRIYVLDKQLNSIFVFKDYFNQNKFVLFNEWSLTLNSPNDFIVENDSYMWIVDSGNNLIKKYSLTGELLNTFTGYNNMISMVFDSNGYIHILLPTKVVVYTSTGLLMYEYDISLLSGEIPRKIIKMVNGGFMYICLPQRIMKVRETGEIAGIFANTVLGGMNYTSILHADNKIFYIVNSKNILEYIETFVITDLEVSSLYDYKHSINDIYIKKNEFGQDWVYNKAFSFIWDNIELMRRSIIGKPIYEIDELGIPNITIRDFEKSEYNASLPIPKDDIYVGINEIFSAEVFNRCVKKLIINQERLLELLREITVQTGMRSVIINNQTLEVLSASLTSNDLYIT